MQQVTKSLFIKVGEVFTAVRSCTVDRIAYAVIVGKSRLSESNAEIGRRSNGMKLRIRYRLKTLKAKCSESENSIHEHTIKGKQFARMTRISNCEVAHVLIRPLQDEGSCQGEHPKDFEILSDYYTVVLQP